MFQKLTATFSAPASSQFSWEQADFFTVYSAQSSIFDEPSFSALPAALALGGDIGCAAGPGVVGAVSGLFEGENRMKYGIFAAAVFPLLLLLLIAFMKKVKTEK